MALMISYGGELVRYNPSTKNIEYSTNQGRTWMMRCSGSNLGKVTCIMPYGKELMLCSDKGVYYSTNSGRSWMLRCSSRKDFIDMQDMGKEILASTDNGHIYYSTNQGRSWMLRK